MNAIDEIRAIKRRLTSLKNAITDMEISAGPHGLLSETHNDTTPAAVTAGASIRGNAAGTAWERVTSGTNGYVWKMGAAVPAWGQVAHSELTGVSADQHHNHATIVSPLSIATQEISLAGLTAIGDGNDIIGVNAAGNAWEGKTLIEGANVTITHAAGQITIAASGGGGGTTFYDPDYFPTPPTSQSDHFDNDSIDGKWVEIDPGNKLTLSESLHHLKFNLATSSAWAGVYQTLPAGDFTITAKFRFEVDYNGAQYSNFGIILFDDAAANPNTTDWLNWTYYIYGVTASCQITRYTKYDTYGSTPFSAGAVSPAYLAMPVYLRIRRNGTTWYFDTSLNGMSWQRHTSLAQGTYFTPAQFGLGMWQSTGATQNFYCDWCYYLGSDSFLAPGGVRS